MSISSRTFNVKKCATSLRRMRAIAPHTKPESQYATPDDLTPYVFECLYMPILLTGKIPLETLDFSKIDECDLEQLWEALYHDSIAGYMGLWQVFHELAPTATGAPVFI